MSLTVLDITNRQFQRAFRGVDAEEVQAFVAEVATAFEAQARELQALKDQVERQEDEIAGWKGRERMLQETLLTAQRACDEIREAARREADATVADAEVQAEKIVHGAHVRFQRIIDEIHELKRQRVQVAAQIRGVLRAHDKLLEAFGDGERDERVEYLQAKKKAGEEG